MIKKYGYGVTFLLAIGASSSFCAQKPATTQQLVNLNGLEQKIAGAKKIDLQNALINNYRTNQQMGNLPATALVRECEQVLGAYYEYAKNLEKKQEDLPTKRFLTLISKSNELLTIFLVGRSNPKDLQKPYRFVLSKIDDPAIADPLAPISQETKDEIRRNYQFIAGLKNSAPHLVKRLELLRAALG